MHTEKLLKKALLVRHRGFINLIVFLIWEFVFKAGVILFLLYVLGMVLFDYKRMIALGIGESIKEAANDSIVAILILGLIPVIIGGVCIEYIYRKHK